MVYKIMKFSANRNFEGKEIEVQKVSNSNKTAIDLILELTKKFDAFVEKQEKFNTKQEKFNQLILDRINNLVKKNNLKE